jgi:hypothetical protein
VLLLNNSQIIAQAGGTGAGGNIVITTNLLLQDPTSVISASSQFGQQGTITIQSPNAPISGQIQPLGKTPLIATTLLNQRCAALAEGNFSSFAVTGRDSLPTEPSSWLASPLVTLSPGTSSSARGEEASLQSLGAADGWEMPIVSLHRLPQAGIGAQITPLRGAGCRS